MYDRLHANSTGCFPAPMYRTYFLHKSKWNTAAPVQSSLPSSLPHQPKLSRSCWLPSHCSAEPTAIVLILLQNASSDWIPFLSKTRSSLCAFAGIHSHMAKTQLMLLGKHTFDYFHYKRFARKSQQFFCDFSSVFVKNAIYFLDDFPRHFSCNMILQFSQISSYCAYIFWTSFSSR